MRLVFIKLGDVAGWAQAQIDAMVAACPEISILLDNLKTSEASLHRMQAFLQEPDTVFVSYNGSFRIGPSPATGAMPPAVLTSWYVDGPWVHYGAAAALPPGYVSLFCCEDHAEASRYLGLEHRALFLPHGGPPPAAENCALAGERPIDILFVGNVGTPPDEKAFLAEETCVPGAYRPAIRAAARAQAATGIATLAAWTDACRDRGVDLDGLDTAAKAEALTSVERLGQIHARSELFQSLPTGPRVVIAGDIAPGTLVPEGAEVLGPVGFESVLQLFGQSKIVLNMTPKFRTGATERVWFAVSRGAVIASNPSRLLADFIESDEMICLPSGRPDAWTNGLRRALDNPVRLARMGERAVERYAAGHTWRHRFEGILPDIAEAGGGAGN